MLYPLQLVEKPVASVSPGEEKVPSLPFPKPSDNAHSRDPHL
eukprot:Gb_19251 [translate_table: standard]